jgi:hypothetical protein
MNARHAATLEQIFIVPVPASLPWRDVEALFQYLGADIQEREGSRIAVELNGIVSVFHRPHPHKETKRYMVRKVREFLEAAGVRQ